MPARRGRYEALNALLVVAADNPATLLLSSSTLAADLFAASAAAASEDEDGEAEEDLFNLRCLRRCCGTLVLEHGGTLLDRVFPSAATVLLE